MDEKTKEERLQIRKGLEEMRKMGLVIPDEKGGFKLTEKGKKKT